VLILLFPEKITYMAAGSDEGHINWKGEWVAGDSPFDRANEYSLKQDLIKELFDVTEKYHGRLPDKVIAEAAMRIVRKYEM